MLELMIRFCSILLASVCNLILKILELIAKYAYRSNYEVIEENGSNFSGNRSQKDDRIVFNNSTVFLSSGVDGKVNSLDFENSHRDLCGNITETEDSVFLQSGLISNCSKYEFMPCENVSFQLEEAKEVKFLVQEMFLGSNKACFRVDQHLDDEIFRRENSFLHDFDKDLSGFDENPSALSFRFNLLNINEDLQEKNVDHESGDNKSFETSLCDEEICEEEKETISSNEFKKFQIKGSIAMKDELLLGDQDCSYQDELLPPSEFSAIDANQESEISRNEKIESIGESGHNINDNPSVIENLIPSTETFEDSDDEYIEFEPFSLKTSRFCDTSLENELFDSSNDEDDEEDVLWEHRNLVRQMKIELKNCKARGGLPTISEECEAHKMVEDLRPLEIEHKIEYKDVMDEIHKFYKSYLDKMRKLDVLNYQTLQAMSFLGLKDSEVFTAGKKKTDVVTLLNLPRLRQSKVQRIHVDPSQKSIVDMNHDFELVYVGQLCLSWEILRWLYIKTRELLMHDSERNHSYNRAAVEFQQFQVLLQRFMEDEQFKGQRNQNYVRSRCTIRGLLHVPMIKEDCLKTSKETRDEADVITLDFLAEIIRESMLVFREFLLADKSSTNVVLKGIHGTKIDNKTLPNQELLVEIILDLQKKDRRVRDHIRSRNCIVEKFRKHEKCRSDMNLSTSQVELRLVSRVLFLSRLTADQLLWCQNKLTSISCLGRTVYVEPCFLLFPC